MVSGEALEALQYPLQTSFAATPHLRQNLLELNTCLARFKGIEGRSSSVRLQDGYYHYSCTVNNVAGSVMLGFVAGGFAPPDADLSGRDAHFGAGNVGGEQHSTGEDCHEG